MFGVRTQATRTFGQAKYFREDEAIAQTFLGSFLYRPFATHAMQYSSTVVQQVVVSTG